MTGANRLLDLRKEVVGGQQLATLQRPVGVGRLDDTCSSLLEQGARQGSVSVDEFGAELDGHGELRFPPCPDPPTDAIARLEQQHRAAAAKQLCRRGESRGAGTDDDYVEAGCTHRGTVECAPAWRKRSESSSAALRFVPDQLTLRSGATNTTGPVGWPVGEPPEGSTLTAT